MSTKAPDLFIDRFEGQYIGIDTVLVYDGDEQVVYVKGEDGELLPPVDTDEEDRQL